jgi:hypothetical protein
MHGPGHQSYTEFYRWLPKSQTLEALKNHWECLFADTRNPIGTAEFASTLPAETHEQLVRLHADRIGASQEILEVLRLTPIKKMDTKTDNIRSMQKINKMDINNKKLFQGDF